MAMVNFKKGLRAGLPATYAEGTFYVTTDERAIYLDVSDSARIRLGDFQEFATIADLTANTNPNTTALYYVADINCLAKWNGSEYVQINRDTGMTSVEVVGEGNAVTAAVYSADGRKLTLTKGATYMTAADVDGKIVAATGDMTGYDNVKAYVDKKTEGIATDAALGDLQKDVDALELKVDALEKANAEGGAVAEAIADAKKAGTDAAAAAATAKAAADAAQADVDALEKVVGTVTGDKTVVELIAAAQAKADQGVSDAATAQAAADKAQGDVNTLSGEFTSYKTTNDAAVKAAADAAAAASALAGTKATMDEVNTAIANAGHAVKSDVDTALENLGKAYVAADEALETKLQGNIDKKVDQTAYDTKVGELAAEDLRLAGLISDMDTAYKAADTALDGRVATLEGTITGLSGAMHFKGVKTEIPADVTGYADGDVIIVGDKEYVFNGGAFVEFGDVSAEGERIADLETVVGKAAEGENAATGLVKAVADNAAAIAAEKVRAEAKEAELAQADATNLQAAKDYADGKIADLKIGDYAKQADLDAHTGDTVAHITAAERTAWNAAESNAKAHADGLNTAMDTRVKVLEAIDHDAYKAADTALETALNAEIAKKADASVVSDMDTAYKAADTALAGRIKKLEDNEAGYATTAQVATAKSEAIADAKTETEKQVKALADGAVADNTADIAVLKGTGEGSVAKALADAKAYADTAESDAVATAKTYTDGLLAWGSF